MTAPPTQRERRPAEQSGAPSEKSSRRQAAEHDEGSRQDRRERFDDAAAMRRRRATCERLAVLDCGCSDPWPCRIVDEGWPDGFAAALAHLARCGYRVDVPRPRRARRCCRGVSA